VIIKINEAAFRIFICAPLLILAGCATVSIPTSLKTEDTQNLHKVAVVTNLSDSKLQIFDRTGIKDQYSSYYSMGALSYLLVDGVSSAQVKASLQGDPELLRQALSDFSVKDVFNDIFTKFFKTGFETIGPIITEKFTITEYAEASNCKKKKIKDYNILSKELGVDAVIEINYRYGLGAYGVGFYCLPLIMAEVTMISLPEDKILMERKLGSDYAVKRGYTVDNLRENGGELFRKEFSRSVHDFIYALAPAFGKEASLKDRSYWDSQNN
jgi:hypothetical protein